MSERIIGTVKWFNNRKGWGFISRDEEEDIFVHYTGIQGDGYRTLAEGQQVEYSMDETDKGLQAVDVVVLETVQ